MSEKKLVVMINGSPKMRSEQESVSEALIQIQTEAMNSAALELYKVNVRRSLKEHKTKEDFDVMLQADAIIFTFPLYIFCLPGILMRFLQDFHQYWKLSGGYQKRVKVYAVVNCGFPEAFINEEAIRVIRSFSRQTGAEAGLGIMIGSGGMFLGNAGNPLVKRVFEELIQACNQISQDILEDIKPAKDLVSLRVKFPPKLYYYMGNKGWYSGARKYGLKKKDLYRKPYLHAEAQ